MLNIYLNEKQGIAILEPDGKLSESDFISASKLIDPYIEKSGQLNGIIIHVESFPGWGSFAALISHLKFVQEHHKKITCIALATDSSVGSFAERIVSHFVRAEIKNFKFNELEEATDWIINGE